jgi:5-hydroxyisourate hydrolase
MSQITTHILDTSAGKPAAGVQITLEAHTGENGWSLLSSGKTNKDGRLPGLLEDGRILPPGIYRLVFDTDSYFKACGVRGFYPFVHISFEVTGPEHYHVPLLINPFGYSTYRGS